jgi:hypothetical protein
MKYNKRKTIMAGIHQVFAERDANTVAIAK